MPSTTKRLSGALSLPRPQSPDSGTLRLETQIRGLGGRYTQKSRELGKHWDLFFPAPSSPDSGGMGPLSCRRSALWVPSARSGRQQTPACTGPLLPALISQGAHPNTAVSGSRLTSVLRPCWSSSRHPPPSSPSARDPTPGSQQPPAELCQSQPPRHPAGQGEASRCLAIAGLRCGLKSKSKHFAPGKRGVCRGPLLARVPKCLIVGPSHS